MGRNIPHTASVQTLNKKPTCSQGWSDTSPFLTAPVSAVNSQCENICCQGANPSQSHRANGSCKILSLPTCWFLFYPEASAFLSSLSLEQTLDLDGSSPRTAAWGCPSHFILETTAPNELKRAVRKWIGHSQYLKMTTNIFCKQMLMPIHIFFLLPNCWNYPRVEFHYV